MAFLSVVVKVVGKRIVDSKSAFRAYCEHHQLSRPPLLITAEPKKFFACCPRAMMKKVEPAFSDSCELVPAVPSPPPYHLHRNNRPRSHPPHFALTASVPTQPPPQSIEVRRLAPTATTVRSRRFTPANAWRQHCSFLIGTFHRRCGLVYVSFLKLRIASHIEQRRSEETHEKQQF